MWTKLTLIGWSDTRKSIYHYHKFTKFKYDDTKCKHGRPYWIGIPSFVLTTGNLGRGYGSWQPAEIQITQAHSGGVHFEHVDVMTNDCLSSVAWALALIRLNQKLQFLYAKHYIGCCTRLGVGHSTLSFVYQWHVNILKSDAFCLFCWWYNSFCIRQWH